MRKQKGGILIWQEIIEIFGFDEELARGADTEQRKRIEIMLRKGKKAVDIAEFCDYTLSLVKEIEQSMLVVS